MAAGGMGDVDLAIVAGKAQRVPFLTLPAVFAAPSLAEDLARDIVAELFRDLVELFDRANVGLLVELAQRRGPGVLAAIDAALRQLPGMKLVDMLGPVDAAADEDAAVAIEHPGADAGAVGKGFREGHLCPRTCCGEAQAPSITALLARIEPLGLDGGGSQK